MRRLLSLVCAVALAGAACGVNADGPPEILVDRTACDHCRMLISEPRYAAAYQRPGEAPRVFDDIGCLLASLGAGEPTPAHAWFHDADDGGWITTTDPVFVAGSGIRTPMSGGILAFRDRPSAEASASREGGRIVASVDALFAGKDGVR